MKTLAALGLAAVGALGLTPTLSGFQVPFLSDSYSPPASCVEWYDGCNMCHTEANGSSSCSNRICANTGKGFCVASATSTTSAAQK